MTTARRALTCPSCGFANDDAWHFRACVPTRLWPKELRDRKMVAMGHDPDRMAQMPEKRRMSLHEYRLTHPEANPITTEQVIIHETRQDKDGLKEWDRVEGLKEALARVQPCDRCHRPLVDRKFHMTCKPVDGVPPTPPPAVRSGAGWYNALPEAPDPEPDPNELRDFVRDPQAEVEARVMVEMEQWKAEREAVSGEASSPASVAVIPGGASGANQSPETAPYARHEPIRQPPTIYVTPNGTIGDDGKTYETLASAIDAVEPARLLECIYCMWSAKTPHGLKIHMGKAHKG